MNVYSSFWMNSTVTIFVCGTYSDLSEERGAILDAIQRMGLRHRSMELFGARSEQPIQTCFEEVRGSDILVVIVGDRYGSIVPGLGISYSEAEYDEGYRLGKPCLPYIREAMNAQSGLCEVGPEERELLKKWKAKLMERHTPAYFRETSKLAVQVAIDLPLRIKELEEASSASSKTTPGISKLPIQLEPQIAVRYCGRFGDDARQLLHGVTTDTQGNIIVVGDFWGSIEFGGTKLASAGDRDIFLAKFDQNGNHVWSSRYGDASEQVGVGVGVDTSGAVFVASAFTGTLDFGGNPLVSKGRYNAAVAKLDPSGHHIWSRCFGDEKYHVPECIAVAPSGQVTIAGRFQGSSDFGGGRIESQSSQTDIFLATLSADGDYVWGKRFGGPYEQQTRSISIDSNGNIALAGVFKGVITIGGQTLTEENPGDYCGFLAKFDEHGNALWCKRFGEPHAEQGSAVAFDRSNGDMVAAGIIRNKLPLDGSKEIGSLCLFARYDSHGVLRWSKTFGAYAFPSGLSVASDGRILLTGHFEKTVDFGLGPLVSAGGHDLFAVMFTPDGKAQWSRRFGDERQQFLVSGVQGVNGAVVLAGSFHGTIDFGTGALVASGYDGAREGTEDVFLAILENKP